jgi:hypothetical protein
MTQEYRPEVAGDSVALASLPVTDASLGRLRRQWRLASAVSAAGAVLVLGALCWSSIKISSAESNLQKLGAQQAALTGEIQSLNGRKADLEGQIADLAKQKDGYSSALNGLLLRSGPGAAAALQQATAANPEATQVVPIVYLYVASQGQIPFANKVASSLRSAGFVVPKAADHQTNWNNPDVTELRFYEQTGQSTQDLTAIMGKLQAMSVQAKPLIPKWTGARKAPSRQYEIWFSPTQFGESQALASAH